MQLLDQRLSRSQPFDLDPHDTFNRRHNVVDDVVPWTRLAYLAHLESGRYVDYPVERRDALLQPVNADRRMLESRDEKVGVLAQPSTKSVRNS